MLKMTLIPTTMTAGELSRIFRIREDAMAQQYGARRWQRAWPRRLLAVLALLAAALCLTCTGRAQQASDGLPTGPVLRIETGRHGAMIQRIATDAENRFPVTASYDKTVRVWSLPDGRLLRILRLPLGFGEIGKAFSVAMSPDGSTVAAGGWTAGEGSSENIFLFDPPIRVRASESCCGFYRAQAPLHRGGSSGAMCQADCLCTVRPPPQNPLRDIAGIVGMLNGRSRDSAGTIMAEGMTNAEDGNGSTEKPVNQASRLCQPIHGTFSANRCFIMTCHSGEGVRSRSVASGDTRKQENAMNRMAKGLTAAALASALLASGPAWAQMGYPNYLYDSAYNTGNGYYGYPSQYSYRDGYPSQYSYRDGYPSQYSYGYGYPYGYNGYSYDYGNPFGVIGAVTAPLAAVAAAPVAVATGATAPLVTGRSVATSQSGDRCTTPAKTCELYHASFVGNGCSCRVSGGRARGSVTP